MLFRSFTFFVIAGEPGESKYPVSHTIWHVASMLGIYFLLDLRYGRSWFAVGTRNLFKPKRQQQPTDLPATATDLKSRTQSSSSSSFIYMNNLIESDRKQKYILIKGKYNDDNNNSDSESEEEEDYESEAEIKQQPKLIISTSKHIPIKTITTTATATTTVKKKEKNPIELFEQNMVFELTPKIIERFNKLPVTNFELLHTSKKPTKKLKRVKDEQ